MKSKLIITFLIIVTFSFAQKIEQKTGDFIILKTGYLIKDKNGKKKISKSEFYFNNNAEIIEKIKYGRHHHNKLNVVGNIEQFYYKDGKLITSEEYISSCKSCNYYKIYTKHNYDENDSLTNENTYLGENDSLFMSVNYEYKPNMKETHFNTTTFNQKVYNSEQRLIQFNQVFEDTKKLRWQYLYDYIENCRIGSFQTYYEDGNNHSKKEIECYDSQKRIISKENISTYKTKIIYSYSKKGILNEVKEYESFNNEDYKLKYLIKYKFKARKEKLDPEKIKKINSELIEG